MVAGTGQQTTPSVVCCKLACPWAIKAMAADSPPWRGSFNDSVCTLLSLGLLLRAAAIQRGVKYTMAFANSPPVFMTVSGSVTGKHTRHDGCPAD